VIACPNITSADRRDRGGGDERQRLEDIASEAPLQWRLSQNWARARVARRIRGTSCHLLVPTRSALEALSHRTCRSGPVDKSGWASATFLASRGAKYRFEQKLRRFVANTSWATLAQIGAGPPSLEPTRSHSTIGDRSGGGGYRQPSTCVWSSVERSADQGSGNRERMRFGLHQWTMNVPNITLRLQECKPITCGNCLGQSCELGQCEQRG
jgi:hypothetical protein